MTESTRTPGSTGDGQAISTPDIEACVEMKQTCTHYFDVSISVTGLVRDQMDFVMPVWTPGSYLVREFARNVEEFSAADGSGNELAWTKVEKSRWRVLSRRASKTVVRYRLYAFEPSVRTSFLDDSRGFICGAGVFMYLDGYLHIPYRVKIDPFPGWSRISTGLDPVPGIPNTYLAPDFDTLIDCPIEVGHQKIMEFEARGVPHLIAVSGDGNFEADALRSDICRIVETAADIVGEIPYKHYTFLILLSSEGGGGLEHANSAALIVSRWTFKPEESYRRFLGLVAHEFFHVWNVKRIRPRELGPFDYTRENYTRLLWVSEGFTDYYSDLILRRAGLATPNQYLERLSKSIRDYQETPGRSVETPAEASFDAWIRFYRQDGHSQNASVSYYLKGALIALVLDLDIRHRTATARSLDDVLRLLYHRFYTGLRRGFTEEEFRSACEEIAGAHLVDIFEGYAYGTREIDFARYLGYAGLKFAEADEKEAPKAYLGVNVKSLDGKIVIVAIPRGTPGYDQGLNINDEIIAVDGYRSDLDSLQARLEEKTPGSRVDILISRAGKLRSLSVVLGRKETGLYRIVKAGEATPEQEKVFESWLRTPWR
jgi:predicted metalloprotease with PDZ domain